MLILFTYMAREMFLSLIWKKGNIKCDQHPRFVPSPSVPMLRWSHWEVLVRLFSSTEQRRIKLNYIILEFLPSLGCNHSPSDSGCTQASNWPLATGVVTGWTGSSRSQMGWCSNAAYRAVMPKSWVEGTSVFSVSMVTGKGYLFVPTVLHLSCTESFMSKANTHSHHSHIAQYLQISIVIFW